MTTHTPATERISLTAAGELRDALTALEHGDAPAAVAALMAISTDEWTAIDHRLKTLGGSLRELVHAAGEKGGHTPALAALMHNPGAVLVGESQ